MEKLGQRSRATRSSLEGESPFILIPKREFNSSSESNLREDSPPTGPSVRAVIQDGIFIISGLTVRSLFQQSASSSHLLATDHRQGLFPSLNTDNHKSPRNLKLHGPRSRRDSEASHLLEEARAVAESKNDTEWKTESQGHPKAVAESYSSPIRNQIDIFSKDNPDSITATTARRQERTHDQKNDSPERPILNGSPVANGSSTGNHIRDLKDPTEIDIRGDKVRSPSKKRKRRSLSREEAQHQRARSTPAEAVRKRLEHNQQPTSTRSDEDGHYGPFNGRDRFLNASLDGVGEIDLADPAFRAPFIATGQDYTQASPSLPHLSIQNLRQHEIQLETIESVDVAPSVFLEPIDEAPDSSSSSIRDAEENPNIMGRRNHGAIAKSIEDPSNRSRLVMPYVKAESDLGEELDAVEDDSGSQSGQSLEDGAAGEDIREEASGYSSFEQRSVEDKRLRVMSKICPSCHGIFKNVTKLVSQCLKI